MERERPEDSNKTRSKTRCRRNPICWRTTTAASSARVVERGVDGGVDCEEEYVVGGCCCPTVVGDSDSDFDVSRAPASRKLARY